MANTPARRVDGTGELVLGRLLDGAADLHIGRPRGDPIDAVVGVLDARDDAGADGVLVTVMPAVLAGADARGEGLLLPVLSIAGSGGDAGSAAGVLLYDHAVPRGAGATASSSWRPAAGRGAGAASGWRAHDPAGTTTLASWSPAGAGAATTAAPWSAQSERAGSASSGWRAAAPIAGESAAPWSAMPERTRELALVHRSAMPADAGFAAPWVDLIPRAGTTAQAWREAGAAAIDVEASASSAAPVRLVASIPWQEARRPAYGHMPPPIPVPPPPTPPPPGTVQPPPPAGSPPTRLHLARRIDGAPTLLWLGRADPVGIRIPSLRLYLVINKIRMWREGDGAPLSPTSLTINTDVDSWTWSLSAALPDRQCELLRRRAGTQPVEVGVEINGLRWRFVVTETSGERRHASGGGQITGRSLAVYLSGDYAPRLSRSASAPITARQIADTALENTGTVLDWTMVDWLIPPGCWSASDAAPMDVIARLAEAAGGTVMAAPDSLGLRVSPRYPVLPWEIDDATPDIILPTGPVKVVGWNDRHSPRCNAVFVGGDREGGIIGHVRRRGTAGDLLAPDITDTLITHVDVARQRGFAALAATGPQADITLQLPMLADLGRVVPGQLLEFEDTEETWRGLIRSVSINVQSANSIWQNLGVERHFL